MPKKTQKSPEYLSNEEMAEGLLEVFELYLPHLHAAISVANGETNEQAEVGLTVTRPTKLSVEEINEVLQKIGMPELTEEELKEIIGATA